MDRYLFRVREFGGLARGCSERKSVYDLGRTQPLTIDFIRFH